MKFRIECEIDPELDGEGWDDEEADDDNRAKCFFRIVEHEVETERAVRQAFIDAWAMLAPSLIREEGVFAEIVDTVAQNWVRPAALWPDLQNALRDMVGAARQVREAFFRMDEKCDADLKEFKEEHPELF